MVDCGEGGGCQLVEPQGRQTGAALAYYSVFSVGPIIVIVIAVAGLLFGHGAVASQVMSSIREMLGDAGATAVEAMLAGASRPAAGILATVLGIGALLFAAIGRRCGAQGCAQRGLGGRRFKRVGALALRVQIRAVLCRRDRPRLSPGLARRERGPSGGR